jgi:hypothetical protein
VTTFWIVVNGITLAICLLGIFCRDRIDRAVAAHRAAKAKRQAVEDQAIEAYFAPLRQDRDDYLRTLDLGFTEPPEVFAARLASLDQARRTPAFLAELTEADANAGHLDRHVPTARKEH